jgi:hypothetical protein
MCFSDREPGNWGPRRVRETELRAAFTGDWHIDSLTRDQFTINPVFGADAAEAWLADIVRLTPQ